MLPSLPQGRLLRWSYRAYVGLFLVYLAAPLLVAAAFAFNDSLFPALPWKGFTLGWFFNDRAPMIGLFHDASILRGIGNSLIVAAITTTLSLVVGTTSAFLFERYDFPLKQLCYMLMLAPLVIPGVILGISILVLSSTIANGLDDRFGLDIDALRPGWCWASSASPPSLRP